MNTDYSTEQSTPVFSMKWHKFLIYFATWAAAVVSLINAFLFFSGSIEGEYAQQIYALWPAMKAVHLALGVISLGIAVLAIVTRFALAGYKANGPKLLYIMYACNALINPLYSVLVSVTMNAPLLEMLSSDIASLIVPVAMIALNHTYYTKRAALFTR